MHIESKNQNAKRRIETKNIPYFIFELKKSLERSLYEEDQFFFF